MADIDDLKAAFGQHMVALNQRDLEAFATLYHDHVVVFTDNAPFAVEGKAGFQQGVQTAWDNCGSLTLTPINPQFLVLGDTGLAWGHYAETVKPKDGPLQAVFARYTITFVKSQEQWRAAAVHVSRWEVSRAPHECPASSLAWG